MFERITNIHKAPREVRQSPRDEADFRCLDLSGTQLGARIEELPPGATSSYHHYHTSEEEHVLILEGCGVLYLGDEVIEINKGDHIAFLAGEELAHHLVNTSSATLMYLVFGERKETDVVFYPDSSIVLSKTSKGHRWYSFEAYEQDV